MSTEWFDYIEEEDVTQDNEQEESFYCPYTNAAQCALLAKGWQPQELCAALECEQMKLVERNRGANRRHKAA